MCLQGVTWIFIYSLYIYCFPLGVLESNKTVTEFSAEMNKYVDVWVLFNSISKFNNIITSKHSLHHKINWNQL